MPAERFYSNQPFILGQTIFFQDQEFHHLVNVMRARLGEDMELVNGHGQLAKACIETIEKKRASALIQEVQQAPESTQKLILAQAIPRLNRLEFILEKGTELGMTEIWLFPSARSERKNFSDNQQERFLHLIIAGMKQCGRLFLPKIKFMPSIEEWNEIPKASFFGDVRPEAPLLLSALEPYRNVDEKLICVGPESGFTDEETARLMELGMVGVKLHANILRTDTAALMGLSLLSHQL